MDINKTILKDNYLKSNKLLGFWIYLMSDFIFFSVIFSVYFVLKSNVSYSFLSSSIFNNYFTIIKTCILLFSNLICNIFIYKIDKIKCKSYINLFLLSVLVLGISFLSIESIEFYKLIISGCTPEKNSFLSSIFVLIGSHDIRVFSGIIWILVTFYQVCYSNFEYKNKINIYCICMFWNFLDIIWMFIFTFIYLLGPV